MDFHLEDRASFGVKHGTADAMNFRRNAQFLKAPGHEDEHRGGTCLLHLEPNLRFSSTKQYQRNARRKSLPKWKYRLHLWSCFATLHCAIRERDNFSR